MRAAWRICINGLIGRRRRTLLLALAVALSTALVAAASCTLASIHAGLVAQVDRTLGRAEVRIREVAGGRFPASVLESVARDAGVAAAAPRLKGSLRLRKNPADRGFTMTVWGVDPAREPLIVEGDYLAGRGIERDREAVLNKSAAEEIGVWVGDRVLAQGVGQPVELEVVGIERGVVTDMVKRYSCRVSLPTLERALLPRERGRFSEIAVLLKQGQDPTAAAERLQAAVPAGVLARTTTVVTSGVRDLVRAHRFGFLMIVAVANLASALIILTGLTTSVIERQRELAIMRCIGARRRTLAASQLLTGAIVGLIGSLIGLPTGVGLAALIAEVFSDRLPAGLVVPAGGLTLAGVGAVCAGLLGGVWPAIAAARTKPLGAMTMRARSARAGLSVMCGVVGGIMALAHLAIMTLPESEEVIFWGHVAIGWEMMLTGYFLLAVPAAAASARLVGPAIAWGLRLPRRLLVGNMTATPIRHGFTAGALMLGLALMTDIWTVGSSMLGGWVGGFRFPDAFVQDLNGLTQEDEARLRSLDFVEGTSAITLLRIDAGVFGIEGLTRPPTLFIAFDPGPFFDMTRLAWEAGDEAYARRRLEEGGAVIVAKEFLIARAGFKIGDTFTVTHEGTRHDFEVVGAVSSPGLDLVGYAFDVGVEFGDAAIGAVFGSRADMKRVFGTDAVHLLQVTFNRDLPDREAADRMREALGRPSALVGSGREIKNDILELGSGTMRLASVVAVAVMLIGSLGVSNIILAGIDARRFEFGVLRAVGASRGVLGRLIVGEVLVVVVAACIIGTALGLHGAFTGARFQRLLAGIDLTITPPVRPILMGWGLLTLVTLLVALPMILRLARSRPRDLLGATRG